MFVELIYDKRNVAGLPNAQQLIHRELEKRITRVFPDALVKVKPMQANSVKTDASKSDKSVMLRLIEEMFDESDQWLTAEEF
ncbi:DinI-like family protein [Erwinia psidii]|uniref:DinI family protein n=1 Tax=Erwinia psidii TaxID=69224 RepID=A0A3N6UXS0_9GAMM|nr:DinI-like family protein [Erwinia psidii]MCX8955820.1 DinI family protein [Erwinia psidii]MCX8961623.1 DinI family protein [Erwinia psidii]MCX8965723.1 DinI family protein [Erwinia psidii]RQM37655.1 DinI family protein [Erwinia psidii]